MPRQGLEASAGSARSDSAKMLEDRIEQPFDAAAPAPAPAPAPARQAAAAAPARELRVENVVSPEVAAFALARGDELMKLRDVTSARRFYELAAGSGLPQAARAVAQTYDPQYLQRLGATGFLGDAREAARWYVKASELGGQGPKPPQ